MEEKAATADEVMAVAAANGGDDDLGEGVQCSDHPYRTNPGGICAFCLQEKLGKLLSTATPTSFFTTTTTLANPSSSSASTAAAAAAAAAAADILLLKRSKSVAPRPNIGDVADTPRKKKKKKKPFWSFLYHHSSSSATPAAAAKTLSALQDADGGGQALSSSSAGRRVARSRSVGCGNRSFSGDFLERISTGLGDCTLRRAESQRETRRRTAAAAADANKMATSRMKERVRCGGIFRGFGTTSTSSSSSSSYWLSAAGDDDFGKGAAAASSSSSSTWRRNRNWGWAFVSPMRAFKPVVSASKSTFGNANAVAGGINRSTGVGSGSANPPSSLLVGGG